MEMTHLIYALIIAFTGAIFLVFGAITLRRYPGEGTAGPRFVAGLVCLISGAVIGVNVL